jgi:TonB family protein
MIPRTLVPVDARPPALNGAEPSTRRRPTSLDERTLVPAMLPIVVLDGRSSIPAGLPLDSISARVVVPRDINREAYNVVEDHSVPAQPTDLDSRITVPAGSRLPEIIAPAVFSPPDMVAPDVFTSGEVHLVAETPKEQNTKWDIAKAVASVAVHILAIIALIQFFARPAPTKEQEEIARTIFTPLVAPGAFDLEQPKSVAPPAPHVKVNPQDIRRVAPTPVRPTPEPPKVVEPPRELPAAPVPKNTPPPLAPTEAPTQKVENQKPGLILETPDAPTPRNPHLTLPQGATSGQSLNDLLHGDRPSGPRAIVGGGPVRSGGLSGRAGSGGQAYGGLEMLTPDEGVDFSGYLQRVYLTVYRNWIAVMPESAQLGDQGIVQLTFHINRDGSVTHSDPVILAKSGKEPLDRAAYSSIRASSPFDPLPPQFSGPNIELRYTYYYNINPNSLGH